MSTPERPDAVRLALSGEALPIATLQRRSWAVLDDEALAATLLREVDLDQMTDSWTRAITRPPDARCRVLVSVEGDRIVGVAVTAPSSDPDADPGRDGSLGELTVDPAARRRGHGGRLLNAAADTLRADGFRTARIWVSTTDDDVRRWLGSAGWAADGAHRELGAEDGAAESATARLRQVRLHTDLTETPAPG